MILRILSVFVALLLPAAGQDNSGKESSARESFGKEAADEQKPAAGADATALPKADAGDEAAVRALIGQKAVISGNVTDTFASEKGITFLNVEGGKFTVVCWKDSYSKFEGGSPAKLYKGKKIEITGKVEEYRKKAGDATTLQIKLNDPAQIKVTGDSATGEQTKPDKKADAKDEKKADKKGETDKKEDRRSPEGKDKGKSESN